MKRRKLLGSIAAFLMAAPLMAGIIGAGATTAEAAAVTEKPSEISFTLHKKVWDAETGIPDATLNTGLEMDFSGAGLNGVDFTLYDVTNIYYNALQDNPQTEAAGDGLSSADALQAIQDNWNASWVVSGATVLETKTTANINGEDGLVEFTNVRTTDGLNRDKVLMFVETYSPADISIIATPMVILLPVMMPNITEGSAWDGSFLDTFNDDVHLYAKNQQQTPTKTIAVDPSEITEIQVKEGEGTTTVKVVDLEKGVVLPYEITSPIPYFIRDVNNDQSPVITNFTIVDVPTENLKYVTDSLEVVDTTSNTKLVLNTDYTITEEDGGFHLEIITKNAETGFANTDTLAKLTPGSTLTLNYNMVLTATVQADILHDNKATITIGREGETGYQKDIIPDEKVLTGGRKFQKIDGSSQDNLVGAEFILWNADRSKYAVFYNGTDTMENYSSAATNIIWNDRGTDEDPAPNATRFMATAFDTANGKDWSFDVVGLEYGNYQMQEVVAPEGYALPNGESAYTNFNVAWGTYDKEAVSVEMAENVTISNTRKGTLPSTGGAGIVAFLVIGTGMMIGAYLWFKNSKRTVKA
ncbi:SpaH/EbpB family LPXTG-anchored major pilin [Enterococcus sp. LJL90]